MPFLNALWKFNQSSPIPGAANLNRALAIIESVMKTEPPEHLADQALFYQVHFPQALLNPSRKGSSTRLVELDTPTVSFEPSTLQSVAEQYGLDATFAVRRMEGIVRRVKSAWVTAKISDAIWKALTKLQDTDTPGNGVNPASSV